MSQRGFTITELMVSIAIASVVSVVMMYISVTLIGSTARARMTAELAIESQILLRSMVEDARLAQSLSAVNQNTDPNAPPGGWVTNDPSNIIVIGLPAIDAGRNILYNEEVGLPYSNEIVYYGDESRMYRRIIAESGATGNVARTSCPPPLASTECPSDQLFTEYLSNLSFVFYDDEGNTTADATAARSVQISVRLQRSVFGSPIAFNNTIRTTLRNR